jgi:uncharacterized membrane protein YsdA (DUF1294 family)
MTSATSLYILKSVLWIIWCVLSGIVLGEQSAKHKVAWYVFVTLLSGLLIFDLIILRLLVY